MIQGFWSHLALLHITFPHSPLSPHPLAGTHSLLDDEAVIVGGTCHSHATKDL